VEYKRLMTPPVPAMFVSIVHQFVRSKDINSLRPASPQLEDGGIAPSIV
jgi:hypothetical protein